jgi:hypothetical protein
MVGDYISTSVIGGKAVSVLAVGKTPANGQAFGEGLYTVGGLNGLRHPRRSRPGLQHHRRDTPYSPPAYRALSTALNTAGTAGNPRLRPHGLLVATMPAHVDGPATLTITHHPDDPLPDDLILTSGTECVITLHGTPACGWTAVTSLIDGDTAKTTSTGVNAVPLWVYCPQP